ncbi:hypothetical protein EOV40_002680 [Acetobacter oryzoeni]|uniref:Uncharacterized protein n=1 Tax=Acetobacter oryzoeni TaxID=2500548 RepID=A0A5B9GGP0_9PROT|nr:hypothetical protein EOV40_002680 [Acetobacter oryzoeni]
MPRQPEHTLGVIWLVWVFSAFHAKAGWFRNPAIRFFHALALAQTGPARHINHAYAQKRQEREARAYETLADRPTALGSV